MKMHRFLIAVCPLLAVGAAGSAGTVAWLGMDGDPPSICRGTASHGSLEGGRRLPYSGANYRAYSLVGYLLGRTFVHSAVRDAMRDAYAELSKAHPELRFVYAESGWPRGGKFPPHKTHANGTSVDFHVPVRTLDGRVSELPTSVFNKWGYAVEFDRNGQAGSHGIDFEAMGLHLLALERASRAHKIRIQRVIFHVGLRAKLSATKSGALAMSRVPFQKHPSWVRHDEHYHVDFDVPCE